MNKEKEMRGNLINMKVNGNNNLNNRIINNEDRINREIEYNKNYNKLILEQRDLNNKQINYFNNKDYEKESERQYNLYLNELEKNKNNKLNEEEYNKNEKIINNKEIINNEELNQQLNQINNSNIPINQNNIILNENEKLNQQIKHIENINDNNKYLEYMNKKENINNEINSNIESFNDVNSNIKKNKNINLNEMSKYERLEYETYLIEKEGKNINPEYLKQLNNYDLIEQKQPIEDDKKLLLSSQNIINKRDNLINHNPYTTKSYNLGNTNLEKNIISHSNNHHHYNKTFNNCLVNGNRIISGRLQYAGNKIIG